MRHRHLIYVLAFVALLAGCAKARPHPPSLPSSPSVETGLASWYGYPYHGRKSANGEVFDQEKMTAAHRTLAFGTRVRVTNVENSRAVDVRITDRGPFVDGRVIDVSRAAARALGIIGSGVAQVRLEIVDAPAPLPSIEDGFAVQVGAFRERANADRLSAEMRQRYGTARIVLREGEPKLWRVLVGQEHTLEGCQVLAERLKGQGFANFVVRLDPQ
jgi:rare lipoprotein A